MNARLARYGPIALVFLAAFAVYANSLANAFAYDDVFIVQWNGRVHQLTDLSRIWLTPYWPSFGTELGLWRPLTIFGYALQWAIAGDSPWFFHLVNVLLHATASVLAYLLLFRLTGTTTSSLLGALLFAVHPVHTEVVANVVGQAELIAGVTTLAACLLYASRPEGPAVGWGRRIGLVVLFAAGILAKESAIVLPGLLMALDFAQRRVRVTRSSLDSYVRAMAMLMFLLGAAAVYYFSVRVGVLGSIGGLDAAPSLPFLRQEHRILVAFRAWLEYARLLVFPLDLSADYSPGVILPVEGWTPMVALGAAVLAGTTLIAVLTPSFPRAGLAAAWLLITALPTSNLLVPIGVVVAERLLYTPSFTASLAVAFLWLRFGSEEVGIRVRRGALAALAVVVVLMGIRTVIRNPDWKNNDAVFAALIRDHPESYRSQWYNAARAHQSGQQEIGDGYMRLAHRIWSYDPEFLNEVGFRHLGYARFDSAVAVLERAREITDWVPRTQVLLMQAYVGTQRYDDVMATSREALRAGAHLELVLPVLAQAYEGRGDLDHAVGAWRAAVRNSSTSFWSYWSRLARALARYGDRPGAMEAADSARAHVSAGDTASIRIVEALRDEIAANCYEEGGAPRDRICVDEVGQWRLLAPILTTVKIARESQNAIGEEAGVAQPDSALSISTIQESTR